VCRSVGAGCEREKQRARLVEPSKPPIISIGLASGNDLKITGTTLAQLAYKLNHAVLVLLALNYQPFGLCIARVVPVVAI